MAKIPWAQKFELEKLLGSLDVFQDQVAPSLYHFGYLNVQIQFLMHLPSNKQKEHVESKRKSLKYVLF